MQQGHSKLVRGENDMRGIEKGVNGNETVFHRYR
jgi:hypothetical protein